jgi:hypothetical protein
MAELSAPFIGSEAGGGDGSQMIIQGDVFGTQWGTHLREANGRRRHRLWERKGRRRYATQLSLWEGEPVAQQRGVTAWQSEGARRQLAQGSR